MKNHQITPNISAVLIVRDEQDCIANCLRFLIDIVDEIVVVDTGSKDRTLEIIDHFPVQVFHYKWTHSFAEARNFAIANAKGPFILTIDADEIIFNRKDAKKVLQSFAVSKSPNLLGTVQLTNLGGENSATEISTHVLSRFFKKTEFRYKGSIHEQLTTIDNAPLTTKPTGLVLHHTGYSQSHPNRDKKWQRNKNHLSNAIKNDGSNEYLHFQMGKTFFVQKQYEMAIDSFEISIKIIDWTTTPPCGSNGSIANGMLIDLICSLTYSYVNTNNLPQALQTLENHIALDHGANTFADLPHALGYVYLMVGDIKKSSSAYLRSLELGAAHEQVKGTGSFSSYFHLGLLCEAVQENDKALKYYKKAIKLNPKYAPALARLELLGKDTNQ